MVEKVLVVSTDHVPPDVKDGEQDFSRTYRVRPHTYGWILFIGDPEEAKETLREQPGWFRPILEIAIREGCSYIDFDYNAPLTEGLRIYNDTLWDPR